MHTIGVVFGRRSGPLGKDRSQLGYANIIARHSINNAVNVGKRASARERSPAPYNSANGGKRRQQEPAAPAAAAATAAAAKVAEATS